MVWQPGDTPSLSLTQDMIHHQQGHLIAQTTLKTYDIRVYEVHHSGMEHQVHHMKIGQKNLIKQPGDITKKCQPLPGNSFDVRRGKEQVRGKRPYKATGNHPKRKVEQVEFPGEHHPDCKGNDECQNER